MLRTPVTALVVLISLVGFFNPLAGQDQGHAALDSPYASYGDNGLPFFGQTLDARKLGAEWPSKNLTPRGIILHLDDGYHACFDPDLLRLALLWKADSKSGYLTMNGMAPGSYRQPHRKSPSGQSKLPTPLGRPLLANGLHRGVSNGPTSLLQDPRTPGLDPNEPGLGPLPDKNTGWLGLRLEQSGPVLCYEFHGTRIEEQWEVFDMAEETPKVFRREITIAPHTDELVFALATDRTFTVPPAAAPTTWTVETILGKTPTFLPPRSEPAREDRISKPVQRIWSESINVSASPPESTGGSFVFDELPLPLPNPWKRNVRPSDIDFFPDGRLALVTFDGDVWIADDVSSDHAQFAWSRFAGGLHEPLGLRIVDQEIVVFDRNGLVRLSDRDGNGEADFYENFCDLPAQTAETREFAMSMEAKPGGGFYLAKGGQVGGSRGKLNGSIVEVSADGRELRTVATGLRQPFLGLNPKTGFLTASDQQGHWVPATPLHVIKDGAYYGFQPTKLGASANDGKVIVDPPLWIPHFVNQSGARQVWLHHARMGVLNDTLVHLGYNRPALFKIYLDPQGHQGAVTPVLDGFPSGLLGGRVSPKDGLLYLAGLNIWGTVGKKVQGLYRVRPTEVPSFLPREIRAFKEGLLLSFDHALEPTQATNLAHYSVDRWNYRRTNNYGSGHYKPDGNPGQEPLAVSCVYLSEDHQSVFLGIPGMIPIQSLRVTYRVKPKLNQSAYLTIRKLEPVNLTTLGFEEVTVDLAPTPVLPGVSRTPPSADLGRQVATRYGCLACHSIDGSRKIAEEPSLVVGPGWKGLYQSKREFTAGSKSLLADEAYLRESILHPARRVTRGFETTKTGVGMPSYLGVLNDAQLESLILFIKSLK